MGHCRYCGHGAGWLRRSHRQCAATYRQGLAQLVDLVVAASGRPDFTQRRMLRILDRLAQQCYVPADYLPAVLAAGWHLSDMNRMVDDVLTQSETVRLREFRDGHHPASQTPGDRGASMLGQAARAAVATRQRSPRLERVSNLLERSGLSREEGRALLLQAWETAVARQLGDVGIDLDREAALLYYARHFDLDDAQLDHHGMLRQFVQGAAIAESAAGLVPQRMNFPQGAPAAALLRRSEQLVWLFDDVECCLGQLPPEPSPTITGVAVNGGGKVDHMGGSIVGLRRWKTVPPAAFYKVDYQPLEGETDVSSGDVRSGAAGLHGGRHECSGSLPGVRPAPGHGAQDAGLLGAARLPARGSATATQAGALHRRDRRDPGRR